MNLSDQLPKSDSRIATFISLAGTILGIAIVAVGWYWIDQIRPPALSDASTAKTSIHAPPPPSAPSVDKPIVTADALPGVPQAALLSSEQSARTPDGLVSNQGAMIFAGNGRAGIWGAADYDDMWLGGDLPGEDPQRALFRKGARAYWRDQSLQNQLKLDADTGKLLRSFGQMAQPGQPALGNTSVGQQMRVLYTKYFAAAAGDRPAIAGQWVETVRTASDAMLQALKASDDDRYPKLLATLTAAQQEAILAAARDAEAHPEKYGIHPDPADGVYPTIWAQAAAGYMTVQYVTSPGDKPNRDFRPRMPAQLEKALDTEYAALARLATDAEWRAHFGLNDEQAARIAAISHNRPAWKVSPAEEQAIGALFDAYAATEDAAARQKISSDLLDAIRAAGRQHYAAFISDALKPLKDLQAVLTADQYSEIAGSNDALRAEP